MIWFFIQISPLLPFIYVNTCKKYYIIILNENMLCFCPFITIYVICCWLLYELCCVTNPNPSCLIPSQWKCQPTATFLGCEMEFKSNINEMLISRMGPIYLLQTGSLSANCGWDPKECITECTYRSSLNFSHRNTRGQINIIMHSNISIHS